MTFQVENGLSEVEAALEHPYEALSLTAVKHMTDVYRYVQEHKKQTKAMIIDVEFVDSHGQNIMSYQFPRPPQDPVTGDYVPPKSV